ncbi:MAG: AMP-binding protein [Eubacterium sp.]|nr:AMP-binding protein [Eubacterium sp.]
MSSLIRHWNIPFSRENEDNFLIDRDGGVSYNEFMRRATAVAVFLERENLRGQAIGVEVDRSLDSLVRFMGVLLSGNYYVPISNEMPEEKVEKIREQIQLAAFLHSGSNYAECVPEVDEKDYERLYDALADIPEESPLYVIFTSGSTGVPKGIIKSHGSMMSFMEAYVQEFGWSPEERLGNQTPFYFDASAKDFYLSLYVGCSMVILDTTLFSRPKQLLETLNEQRITAIQWVPSALMMVSMLGTFRQVMPMYLRRVFFVGEAMAQEQLRRWIEALPEVEFVNLYGASEMAGICAFCRIHPREFLDTGAIPIGYPLSNSRICLMDEEKRETKELGAKGEIWLCSEALASGYLGDEKKTQDNFIKKEGCLWYRTGDQAFYDEKGRLVFAGREDFQIKHMGHRIELEEIEKTAQTIPEIRAACCVYVKNKLVLFYEGNLDKAELTRTLKEKLPDYMMPNRLEWLEQMPMNANGKKERKSLENKVRERGRRNGRNKRNHS